MRTWTILVALFSLTSWAQGANDWLKKNDFAGLKREQAVAVSFGNNGFVGTGVDTAETVLNDWWKYNPTTDSWTQVATLNGPARRSAFAFSTSTRIYIGGGVTADEATLGAVLNDLWEYNPTSNAWVQKQNYPANGGVGAYYAAAFSLDDKGYVVGGKYGPNMYSNQLWEYKPSLDLWTARANFTGGVRYNLSAVSVGNKAFVGLGTNNDIYCNDWWEYSPATNLWTRKADFAGGHRAGASTFSIYNRAYVCLGTNGGMKQDLFVYVPDLDVWYPRSDYGGSERKQAIAFAIQNRAFVGTGSGTSGKKQSMYEYISEYELELTEQALRIYSYPNPATDWFTVQSESIMKTFQLIDGQGQIVSRGSVESNTFSLERGTLPAGTYVLQVELENDGVVTSKVNFL